MAEEILTDERDATHFWINCPGCGYGGRIGVPIDYPADVVTCPKCRENVRVRPQARVLWRAADAGEFLKRRFPGVDWNASEQGGASEAPKPTGAIPVAAGPAPAEDVVLPATPCEKASEPARRAWRQPARPTAWKEPDNDLILFGMLIAATALPLAVVMILSQPRRQAPAEAARAAPPHEAPPKVAEASKPAQSMPAPTRTAAEAFRRAKLRLVKRDDSGAICDLDDALRWKPDFVWCYYYRAGAYSRMGNQVRALSDLNQAIDAMPAEPKAWRARAIVHQRMGRLTAAVDDAYQAVELANRQNGPDGETLAAAARKKADQLVDELYRHATDLLRARRTQAAIAELSEVLRHKPARASPWLRRALAYEVDGKFDQALADLNVALSMRPGPADAFKVRSVLHERKNDYASALADMRAAQRLAPGRADYAVRVRWLLRRQQSQSRRRQMASS